MTHLSIVVNDATLSPVQCKMARAALGWGIRDLGSKAEVAPNTVTRFENGGGIHQRTLAAMRSALEAAGIEFLDANGIRLRQGD